MASSATSTTRTKGRVCGSTVRLMPVGVGDGGRMLPAGRGVTVAGARVGVREGVSVGRGVAESTPVTVGDGVRVGVMVGVFVAVGGNGVSELVAVGVGVTG